MQQAQHKPLTLNLKRICLIRSLVLSGQITALLFAKWQLQLPLAYSFISSILIGALLLTALSFWRLRQPWPVGETELFTHLLADIMILTWLLYFAGGATNPFVSYYLIPLTISAAALSRQFTWIIAVLSIAMYTFLLFFHHPLALLAPHHTHNDPAEANTHLLGMLATFTISVLLITYFVVNMASTLRQRDQALARARENTLRDEHILGIATLAASTAHKLGTPLSTISVLANEIQHQHRHDQELATQIDLIKAQLQSCKSTLRNLSHTAQSSQPALNKTSMAADEYIDALIDQWRIMRPEATPAFSVETTGQAPQIHISTLLDQAIHNLLNNAEDASPGAVTIKLIWNRQHIIVSIQDRGAGISADIAEQIGQPFFTTKTKGLGLGLFLSHAAIERHQGSIKLYQHQGTLIELTLPIADSR